jgi:hypothetical protein
MSRFIVYTSLIIFLYVILPLPGSVKESNLLSDAMFLRGDKVAVTFPWQGVLIKPGITQSLRFEVLAHEDCHVEQIKKIGGFKYIVEYNKNPVDFEKECYLVSDNLL